MLSTSGYRASSASTCKITFTQLSPVIRTDVKGYKFYAKFKIDSGPSWMEDVGTHYDATWDRVLQFTIGGVKYSSGQHIIRRKNPGGSFYTLSSGTGKFFIKRRGISSDRFFKNNTYEYEVELEFPYDTATRFKARDYATAIHVLDGNLTHPNNTWPFLFGTFPTSNPDARITGTLRFPGPVLPNAPATMLINGSSVNIIDQAAGSKNINCSWGLPSNHASVTGGVQGYNFFRYKNGSYIPPTSGLWDGTRNMNTTIPLADKDVFQGRAMAVSLYGNSPHKLSPTYTIAVPPPAPPDEPRLARIRLPFGWVKGEVHVRNASSQWKKAAELHVYDGTEWKKAENQG